MNAFHRPGDNAMHGAASSPFPGQKSRDAADSDLVKASGAAPAGKRRRKKRFPDPFDGLPPIKSQSLHEKEINTELKERPKGKKKKGQKWFSVTQFDDPFNQMVWVLFRSADRGGDSKLNKKELGLILNSPKLELTLTSEDITNLLMDCSMEDEKNAKTCTISFQEFLPLGRLVLMFYYSKLDESSKSKWCILDKGRHYGVIYFNKLTGHASISVPSDYYSDILNEPDLLESALHDLFEDADLDNDGKINITDFLRIIRSEDFGLFLTNGDVEEIMKYFVSTRGREIKVEFVEFLPVAKRLLLTVYRSRDPTPHEWCHLYTRNVGSFWFNKRTGRADRHPPTSIVRAQQDLLEHRSREIEVFTEVAEELHCSKEDLKNESKIRKELENQLAVLTTQNGITNKDLVKTTSNLVKSREDVDSKSKQILSFEKENRIQKRTIESLQGRADEADRIEANMESLRNILLTAQTSVREKEIDVSSLTEALGKTQKDFAKTEQLAINLQEKIDDLVVQLREEIRRNERIEKELDGTKSYKTEKVEVEDILKETKDELQLRMNQLTHARYEIRDSKSRIRQIESELNIVPDLKTELQEKENQITDLKEKVQELEAQLLQGVDKGDNYPTAVVRKQFRRCKLKNLDLSDKSHTCHDPNCPVNGNMVSAESDDVWAFKNGHGDGKPNGASGSFLELISNVGEEDDDLNIYDLYEPHCTPHQPNNVYADSAPASYYRERKELLVQPKSSTGRIDTKKQVTLSKGVYLYEEDYTLARFIKEGDRVRIRKSGVQIVGMKPSDLRTATVRYVGQLEQEGMEHVLFVGLHMDDAVGNTNGIIDGKRYFYSKRKHGLLMRITEVLYVLNPKTISFDKVSDLVEEYNASKRNRWHGPLEDGPRLIRVT